MATDAAAVPPHEREMTEPAARAFADYCAMPRRSFALLAARYRGRADAVPTRQESQLKKWSVKYGWIDRLRAEAERDRDEAREVRRSLALDCLREYRRRLDMRAAMTLTDLHGVYDRVRDPDPVRQELTGRGGGPIRHDHEHRFVGHDDLDVLSVDELEALAVMRAKIDAGLVEA